MRKIINGIIILILTIFICCIFFKKVFKVSLWNIVILPLIQKIISLIF